jgi:ABC exporter DevB family membrane fusion protein
MKRKAMTVLAVGLIAGAAVYAAASRRTTDLGPTSGKPPGVLTVTAPGTVEPLSEEVDVGAELAGKLAVVLVDEGAPVRAGQVIAVIANREYTAQVASAKAALKEREAASRRVVNGARTSERLEAQAAVEEAEAVLANARSARDRRRQLLEQGAVSREEAEQADRAWQVAEAKKRAAIERYALVDEEAREEDRAQAAAAVATARALVDQAEAVLAKTEIRSPIDGVVLRRHHHAGETVLSSPADPVVTVGDVSRLRVRAEIDELDVGHVAIGQRAHVRADAFGDRKFQGIVTRVGKTLGKKHIRTERPAERLDTKVLEVLIDLEEAGELPPRLRVDVFIEVGED